jgi:hypothetical protein
MSRRAGWLTLLVAISAVVLVGCAAGDPRFTPDEPAGFWTGLWHGLISCITLIVGIFVDGVRVYEIDNTGGWYDFGFLLGVAMAWGGGSHGYHRKRSAERVRAEAEWKEIGHKVEAKIRRKVREWAEAEPDDDWEVVEDKAETKLKQRLRDWADTP